MCGEERQEGSFTCWCSMRSAFKRPRCQEGAGVEFDRKTQDNCLEKRFYAMGVTGVASADGEQVNTVEE